MKESWGEQIVQVLRQAARQGIRAGLTEADILLAIANNRDTRHNIVKNRVPGMLKTVRDHLTNDRFGVFEKCGELAPDLKPNQALWRLKKNADTKNVPEAILGPFKGYSEVWLEKWMLSEASARFLEDPPVAKKPVRVEDDDDDDDEGVAPTRNLETKRASVSRTGKGKGKGRAKEKEKDPSPAAAAESPVPPRVDPERADAPADVDMATEGAPSPPRVHEEPADEDMVDDGDAPPTRGEKRARGDDDAGDAKKTMRVLLAKKGTEEAADGASGGGASQKVESAQARREREAAEAAKAAAAEAAAAKAAAEAAAKAAEEAAAKAAEEAAAKAAEEAAAKAAADAAAKAAEDAAAKAAEEAAAAAAARRSIAEAEERRLKTAKEAKDARVREEQEKLRTLRREKDERHPGFPAGLPGAPAGDPGPSGGSSAAAAAAGVASSSSSPALEARRLWEADAAWWSKHGPKEVDPDSGRRRLFTKASEHNRWHFAKVETSFPNGFVYVADDRTIDEARRRRLLGMPADGAHLLAKKINADTAIFLCRVSEDRDGREKGRGAGARPRIDLDVYAAAELYPHAEKGAPPVTADASAFGGRLPAQLKLKKRRCFGVSLRDDLGSCAVSGGLVDLRGLSFKTEKKLQNAEILMPVLLKNARRTDALVAELRARAREAIRAKRGFP